MPVSRLQQPGSAESCLYSHAFWSMWSLYQEKLTRCCYKWLRSDIDKIEDAISQTREKAFKSFVDSEGDISNQFAWLCRIAHNICMDVHRANARQLDLINQVNELPNHFFFADNVSNPLESELMNNNLYERVLQEIDYLPPELRQVVQYKFMYEMDYSEIASTMKLSQENVRKRVQLARKKLVALKEEFLLA